MNPLWLSTTFHRTIRTNPYFCSFNRSRNMEITYDKIKSLVLHHEVHGSQVHVEFQAPNGEIITSKASIRPSNTVGSAVMRNVKRTAMQSARSSLSSLVRGILGGGFLGRIGTSTVNTVSRGYTSNQAHAPSESDIEQAIVDAFKRVQRYFQLDNNSGKVSRNNTPMKPRQLNAFEQIVHDFPVKDAHDQRVLNRVLAEVANADGHISPDEEEFFKSVMPNANVRDLLKADPVSQVEAQMVSNGVKETIYLFSWAICLSDFDPNESEIRILDSLAQTFGISHSRQQELILMAKKHILEQATDADTPRESLFELADQIGLDRDEAERTKIEEMRRNA
jgi:uncharacterized tellurite resistance protein B-like protein